MTTRIKWLICGGLFVLWGTLLMEHFLDPYTPIRRPLRYKTGQTASQAVQPQDLPQAPTILHHPQSTPVRFQKPRNIFAPLFGRPSGPPQPRNRTSRKSSVIRTQKSSPGGLSSSASNSSGSSPAQIAIERARRQLKQFRFLGYLTQHGSQQVFLSNGQAIYIVRQGELVEGTIQVDAIHPKTVVLSTFVPETGKRVQATLSLTKEAS
ncbi:MAG: hypothetical protein D6704_04585 [Nitrospirae bacterium]|nr:MAG: hypothetical protein D6704_04585 [Nitrospirota bacterium]